MRTGWYLSAGAWLLSAVCLSSPALAVPADTCPGESHSITAGTPVSISATLAGLADDYTTFCADESASSGNPDAVYQLAFTSETTVTFRIVASGFDPALSLRRRDCSTEQNGDACLDLGASYERLVTSLGAGTYWLVVDSADGNAGAFTLDITPEAPSCGDGALNPGETCDPGGAAADDGCHDPGTAEECTFGETSSSASTACSNAESFSLSLADDFDNRLVDGPHHNGPGGHAQENDTTEDIFVCGWPATGPENVFHVTAQSTGTLHARIGYDGSGQVVCDLDPRCGDFLLYVRQDQCEPIEPADPDQQLECVDFDPGNQEILEVAVPVTANEEYWVFVDGYDDTWGIGPFWLELWMSP